jgi:hypothetical protein
MIFIGPDNPLVKISGLLRLFSAVPVSIYAVRCQSLSAAVQPVPVFELTGISTETIGGEFRPKQFVAYRYRLYICKDAHQKDTAPQAGTLVVKLLGLDLMFLLNLTLKCEPPIMVNRGRNVVVHG